MIEIGVDTLKIEGDPTKLYEALAKAQAEFLPVPRSDEGQVGTSRKFKYAGYATLMRCVRPALTKHGIALIQPLHWRDDKAVTTTIIAGHGASIQTSFSFNADFTRKDKNGGVTDDCQEFGRCHTYYRRYQLQSILGVEGDDDADNLPLPREQAQFSDKEERKLTAIAHQRPEVASEASAPKGNGKAASAEPKSAPVEKQTSSSAAPSEPTTNGKANPIEPLNADQLKLLITSCMKQKGWKMISLREFFAKHVSEEGFDTADTMPLDQMRTLHKKLVEVEGCAPF